MVQNLAIFGKYCYIHSGNTPQGYAAGPRAMVLDLEQRLDYGRIATQNVVRYHAERSQVPRGMRSEKNQFSTACEKY